MNEKNVIKIRTFEGDISEPCERCGERTHYPDRQGYCPDCSDEDFFETARKIRRFLK